MQQEGPGGAPYHKAWNRPGDLVSFNINTTPVANDRDARICADRDATSAIGLLTINTACLCVIVTEATVYNINYPSVVDRDATELQ